MGEAVPDADQIWGDGLSGVWLDNLECLGNEDNLNDCPHLGLGTHNCVGQIEVAGVKCTIGGSLPPPPPPPSTSTNPNPAICK